MSIGACVRLSCCSTRVACFFLFYRPSCIKSLKKKKKKKKKVVVLTYWPPHELQQEHQQEDEYRCLRAVVLLQYTGSLLFSFLQAILQFTTSACLCIYFIAGKLLKMSSIWIGLLLFFRHKITFPCLAVDKLQQF